MTFAMIFGLGISPAIEKLIAITFWTVVWSLGHGGMTVSTAMISYHLKIITRLLKMLQN